MTAKKTDNRARPHIYRFLPEVHGLIRARAKLLGIKPNEAAERLIKDERETASVCADIAAEAVERLGAIDRFRADLDAAGKLAERQQAEIERLRARELERVGELAAERVASERFRADLESAREATRRADAEVERLTREIEAARAAPQPCALPDDFEAKLTERASGWKGTLPELRARVIALGFSRYDALATDAAKRAAAKGA